jgi:phosphohistidine phosphatase
MENETYYMKKLILLRHAKSSWKDASLDDFDRPLNRRGKKDAQLMAEKLAMRKIKIDLMISSPAKRTNETAKIFANILGYETEIIFNDKLYEASYKEILEVINLVDEKYQNVLLVCHNPGITNLTNYISDHFIENIPTSGIVGLSTKSGWKNINENGCSFLFYDYSKKK